MPSAGTACLIAQSTREKEAFRAFVWVIGVGRERVRVVVSEGKARVRDWWHAETFVDDVRAAAPTGVAGRVSDSRFYAEPSPAERCGAVRCGAARCGTQTRIPEQWFSPCLAANGQPAYTVALGVGEGLNTNSRVIRVAGTACVTRKTGD